MKFHYFDPVRRQNRSAESAESLARQIVDTLQPNTGIRFLNAPFPTDLPTLKSLLVHFEREQLPKRHQFACHIEASDFSEEKAEMLSQLNFREITIVLELENYDLSVLDQALVAAMNFRFKVTLYPNGDREKISEPKLQELYFFLKERQHMYELEYQSGLFQDVRTDYSFRRMADSSRGIHAGYRVDAQLNEQVYLSLYEFLRLRLSSRVNTVLEINPFAELHHYREFNRVHMPWNISLSSIKQNALDYQQLEAIDKTFDAIVLFQCLPRLRDPQKELLMLQNYARSTTEWICVQYNLRSLPILQQMLSSQFQNVTMDSAFWPITRLQGQHDLERLFQFSGLDFDWLPTRVELKELEPFKREIGEALEGANPDAWKGFLNEAEVMFWTGYGTMPLEADNSQSEDGFVSGGFL